MAMVTLPREVRIGTAAGLAAIAALFAATVGLQVVRDREAPPAASEQLLYIQSGEVMRRLTPGFHMLAADVYWIRALQHYGSTKLAADANKHYALLYPLLDITTSLDPRFTIAYRFGAIFLAEPYPSGPGRPDLAVKLLEKGLKAQPDKWEYMQDIGFVYYWWRHDFPSAAAWFSKAAAVPGAPWFLRSLAATTLEVGGSRRASQLMWQQIYDTAGSDWLRRDAEWRLQQLAALDQIDRLQAVVDAYRRRTGAWPDSWLALARARALPGVPLDPTRTPYALDPATGHVSLGESSSLRPLPSEPKTLVERPR
jgi:tetratricopeptide (TPR) repeat protein